MLSRLSPLLLAATIFSAALALPLTAQQVPNPVLPGPSGSGDGLTRDALEAPTTPAPAADASPHRDTARHTTRQRGTATAGRSTKRSATYATINRHHRRHRVKAHFAATATSTNHTGPARRSPRQRAPLVSFIYWWNGWVVRTFHTRSGTVLLDTIGAKS